MSIQDHYPGLVLAKVTTMSLLIGRCPNEHMHIFGFYHQIPDEAKSVDLESMMVSVQVPCRECGCSVRSRYSVRWDGEMLIDGAGI